MTTQILNEMLPYVRTDTYTPFLCDSIGEGVSTTYSTLKPYVSTALEAINNGLEQWNVYSTIQQGKDFVVQKLQELAPQQVEQVESMLAHGISYASETTPITSFKHIPHQDVKSFCQWLGSHSTAASDHMEHVIHNPHELKMLFDPATYTKEPIFPLDHDLILSSTSALSIQHLIHIACIYFLTALVVFFAVRITYYFAYYGIWCGLLGFEPKAAALTGEKGIQPSLYLYGIETIGIEMMKPEWGVTLDEWHDKHLNQFGQTQENADFVRRVHQGSGLATTEKTHLPPQVTRYPPELTINSSREESFFYITSILDQIFAKYNLKPTDIDVLVINCSLFNPTPSHCAMAINHYKMRNDIVSYAIHGMGCSASAIAVNCCRDALACHPKANPIGVVISFENLTLNFYMGKERSMLVSNALFRMGAAGMVFSRTPTISIRKNKLRAKYCLDELIRTHIGSNDDAYRCIWQAEDKDGCKGVQLSKDVPKIAGKALTINLTSLAKRILPLHVLLGYVVRLAISRLKGAPAPTPNFLSVVDHICIHAGGRGVIDTIQSSLNLPDHIVKPSRDVLYRYGNQSSASIWYIFKHLESENAPKPGQKVWQITFGSGFKCNSLIWTRL